MSAALLAAFDQQSAWCRAPSPFTSRVLARSRRWLAEDAEAAAALAAVADDPLAGATALRWAAALHHLALRGLAPWAGLWPPAGPADDAALDAAVRRAWREQRAHCDAALALPPQTNEVQRSAALLPGLLHVAAATRLPLNLLEIGASAGLNLCCDGFHLQADGWRWGDAASPVQLRVDWSGAPPPLAAPLQVARRAACDQSPVSDPLRLASYIWADQAERLARLRAALSFCRPAVERLPAAEFVARELQALPRGQATVLLHSVVWQYLADDEQRAISATVEAAAAGADAEAPLAWLRFEPPQPDVRMELRCRLWPDGTDLLLARCHPHGASVEWLAAA